MSFTLHKQVDIKISLNFNSKSIENFSITNALVVIIFQIIFK